MARFRTQRPKRRWVTYRDADLTAGAVQNILSLASGQTWTIDGDIFTIAYGGVITACTLGGGSGLKWSSNSSASFVSLRRSLANLFPNFSVDDDIVIMVRRVTGKLTSAVMLDRLGTYGVANKEQGVEILASGARKVSDFGGWVLDTVVAAGADAPIVAYRRCGGTVKTYYSLQATGWPRVDQLVLVGTMSLGQDANDTAAFLTTDTVALYCAQGAGIAASNRESTAFLAMRLE